MMEWIGAILIIVATTGGGFLWADRYRKRPNQIRQLQVALQSLEAEIVYGLTPLDEACSHLSNQLPEPLSSFFQHFTTNLEKGHTNVQDAWEESLTHIWPYTSLANGEREVLRQFGTTLGQHDRNHQQKQIRLALTHLEREEAEANDAERRYEKMIKSLGFLSGLLLVLLLI